MQNKNTIKNWKIEITEEGAKLFITEGAVMARDVLNLAREQAIKYNLSVLKIYMHDGQYYDYTFEDDMLYFIHMTEKIENEDISYLMKRAAEKLSTLKLDDRIWSVNFSIDNLPREKNGDLYAACAMVIHFYDRNDDYEIEVFLPGHIIIGSNGGGELYGIDNKGNYFNVPVLIDEDDVSVLGTEIELLPDKINALWE